MSCTPVAGRTPTRLNHLGGETGTDPNADAAGRLARRDGRFRLAAGLALWSALLLITYWWVADGGVGDLADWGSGLTAGGRLAGLWSAQLLLVQVVLMARVSVLESAFGRDRLVRIHRVVGFTSLALMMGHLALIIAGYASGQWSAVLSTTWDLITNYGGMLLATAGTISLIMVVLTSLRAARRRLRYESWHLLHLYAYLGAGLALPHQLWTGQEFLQSRVATIYWWGCWAVTAAAVLVFRIALSLVRSLRHGLRVTSVVAETSDVVSVYLTGRSLDRLPLRAGQFLTVRFLAGRGWTRANPYSISAAPDGRRIRLTARLVGDGSRRLLTLRPGTRVLFEGPYGRLGHRARHAERVLMIGAGVGITPLRSLAEGLPYAPGEAMIIQRYGHTPLFTEELSTLAAERGLQVAYHTSTNQTEAATAPVTTPSSAPSSSSSGSSSSSSSGSSSSASGAGRGGSGSAGSGTTTKPSPSSKTYTGSVADTRWGPVQVKITVASSKITNVDVLQHPDGNHHDTEINSYALPVLVKESLSAQRAKIDMVSGAIASRLADPCHSP